MYAYALLSRGHTRLIVKTFLAWHVSATLAMVYPGHVSQISFTCAVPVLNTVTNPFSNPFLAARLFTDAV